MIEPFIKALNLMANEKTEILLSLPQRGGDDSEYCNFMRKIRDIDLFEIKILPNLFEDIYNDIDEDNIYYEDFYDLFENVFTLIIRKKAKINE